MLDETSLHSDSLNGNLYFVVDGLQRLQSFYIGLCGTYNGKSLYYDLFSECDKSDYDFKFADSESRLPSINKERYILFGKCLWYRASSLFEQLTGMEDTKRCSGGSMTAGRDYRQEQCELTKILCEAVADMLKIFLTASTHYEWFTSANKSAIPLYILAYHIFYRNGGNNSLQYLFDNYDRDKNFCAMQSWLKLSLNHEYIFYLKYTAVFVRLYVTIAKFNSFLRARQRLIVSKIKSIL